MARPHDEWINPRLDFMYNYLDYDNDRHRVRSRFVKEMNKKTTLEDVGHILDKFIIESKAKTGSLYDPVRHLLEKPENADKDLTQDQTDWRRELLMSVENLSPKWLDDPSSIDVFPHVERDEMKDIVDEVEYYDKHFDHSKDQLD